MAGATAVFTFVWSGGAGGSVVNFRLYAGPGFTSKVPDVPVIRQSRRSRRDRGPTRP